MKLLKLSPLLLSLLAANAFADATLLVDEHIKVTAINGQEITHGMLTPLQREFKLGAGTAVVTARYDRLFDLAGDNHDYLRSKDITVTARLADNTTYRLAMPNNPKSYSDAKEYAKAPTLAIIQGDTIISSQTAITQKSGGLLSGIGALFGRNDKSVAQNQAVIAAVNGSENNSASNSAYSASAEPGASVQPMHTNNTLDQFMQLWLHANDEERAKIRQWVAQ